MFLPSQWILVLPPTFTSATACLILVHTALTYIQYVTPHFQEWRNASLHSRNCVVINGLICKQKPYLV